MNTLILKFFVSFILLFLSGCASVGVYDQREYTGGNIGAKVPERIYIRPFGFSGQPFNVSRRGEDLGSFQRTFAVDFHSKLLKRVNEKVLPARLVYPDFPLQDPNSWVIDGHFVSVKEGNRALRSSIGFGLGATKMETFVTISQPDGYGGLNLIGSFQTSGGSNAEPGAMFATPWGSIPRFIMSASTTGLSYDSTRTARMVASVLSEKVSAAGGRLRAKAMEAKRIGSLPSLD